MIGSLDIVPDVYPSGAVSDASVARRSHQHQPGRRRVFGVDPGRHLHERLHRRTLRHAAVPDRAAAQQENQRQRPIARRSGRDHRVSRRTRSHGASAHEATVRRRLLRTAPLGSWFNDLQQPGDTILFLGRPTVSSVWTAGAIVFLVETDTNDVTIVSPVELQTLTQPVVV